MDWLSFFENVWLTLPDGRQISYDRDALGGITAKRVDGVVGKGWIYKAGLKPIAETDSSGNIVSFFVYGSSPLTPDYMIQILASQGQEDGQEKLAYPLRHA